jgi:hypothetical protein
MTFKSRKSHFIGGGKSGESAAHFWLHIILFSVGYCNVYPEAVLRARRTRLLDSIMAHCCIKIDSLKHIWRISCSTYTRASTLPNLRLINMPPTQRLIVDNITRPIPSPYTVHYDMKPEICVPSFFDIRPSVKSRLRFSLPHLFPVMKPAFVTHCPDDI